MKFGTKLLSIFILIGFLPLLIGGLLLFYYFDSYLKNSTYDNLNKISEITSFQIEEFISHSINSANLIAENEILFSGNYSLEEIDSELKKVQQYFQGSLQDITVLDFDGRVVASTERMSYGRWEINPWFLRARERQEKVVSSMYAVLDPEDPIMAIFVPVVLENGTNLMAVVQVNTKPLFNELNFKVGEKGKVILTNKKGDILFHPEKENIFAKMPEEYFFKKESALESEFFIFSLLNKSFVSVSRTVKGDIPDLEWYVLVLQPEEEVYGFLKRMTFGYTAIILRLFILIILFSFAVARKTVRPLKSISLASEKVAQGDFSARAMATTKDEFGDLANNFNKMTQEIEKSKKIIEEERDILEIRVRARTKELNDLTEELENEVYQRTGELQEKLADLEKMNKLMIGREIKMVELKKRLAETEGKEDESNFIG